MEEVTLIIEDQTFKVKKNILCEHSDYFKAMFSGNYLENDQSTVSIDVIDANSMGMIIQYMEIGLIDLFEHTLPVIQDLAMAANFLQITELINQIEYTLELQVSITNWVEIMEIAENASYNKLEQYCAGFGLLSFRNMKPDYIPSIQKLFWYLDHPYLDAGNELDVFKFGFKWIMHKETGADALMLILGCVDVKCLTMLEVLEIKNIIKDYDVSLAAKVVNCLLELFKRNIPLNGAQIKKQKIILCELFTERVFNEVLNLVKESRSRVLNYVAAVPLWKVVDEQLVLAPHYMYTFSAQKGLEKWLEVGDQHLWGWSIVNWGPMRVVVVCGEHGRGTGLFMRDVRVYDTLKKEWIQHGVQLPPRRHGGVTVLDDSLFLVGGVGGFRVTLDSAVIYDLKQRTHRKIARFPEAIQNPAVCTHEGKVYAAGTNNIYRYDDHGDTDSWVRIVGTEMRISCMKSFNGYVYCTHTYFSSLYRFDPKGETMELITSFTHPPASICNLGDRLLFFTRSMGFRLDMVDVEEYTAKTPFEKPKLIWHHTDRGTRINDVSGACSIVMALPPVHHEVSQYHKKYLMIYANQL